MRNLEKFTSPIKGIWLGILLLLLVSGILLLSDLPGKQTGKSGYKNIAVFKFSSRPLLDITERGFIDGLSQRGFNDGKNIRLTRYCAENDLPTANTIAKEIINKKFDIVLTASTPALQVMANANKNGEVIHVFAAVTDPFRSGVGLEREHPELRPEHLAGLGTFQPVEDAILIALQINPGLKKLGVPWCNHESCSEACVMIARKVCDSLGIELLEASVENTTSVLEVSNSLVARGVQALWIGGDNTVELAFDLMVKAGQNGKIPVFCNDPEHAKKGALFGLGANYYQVGLAGGNIAADILEGKKPSEIPIENVVPEKLFINLKALKDLKENWIIPETMIHRADSILR
jgi:putative ABC transport system substrate-binding protein